MSIALATLGRHLDGTFSIQILGGQRMRPEHFAGSAGKDDSPSQATSFRTHINDVIGSQHHILVMLHHNDGVANVTQFLQRVYQALVVALVQADTRLIQYIQHIHQL